MSVNVFILNVEDILTIWPHDRSPAEFKFQLYLHAKQTISDIKDVEEVSLLMQGFSVVLSRYSWRYGCRKNPFSSMSQQI